MHFVTALLIVTALVTGCSVFKRETQKKALPAYSVPETYPAPAMVEKPTKPAPLNTKKLITQFSFASCSDQRREQLAWTAILKKKPDVHLGMGDNIYASTPGDHPMALTYEKQSRVKTFAAFRKAIPILATWDDHDFGVNDGGEENPYFGEAREAYLQFFPHDSKAIGSRKGGIYHSFMLGPAGKKLQVIFLDTRSYRSALKQSVESAPGRLRYEGTKDTHTTLLGDIQWRWLEQELRRPADLRILVSSIQVLAEQHPFEKWGNFPHEKQRLLNLLQQLKTKNLVIISGDRHTGEISHLRLSDSFDLVDVTASSINRPGLTADEPNSLRVGRRVPQENFGWGEINWKTRQLKLSLFDKEGAEQGSLEHHF